MKKFAIMILASASLMPLAATAQSVAEMTEEQLIAFATSKGVCKDTGIATARYEAPNKVVSTCNEDATGFVPLLAAPGLFAAGATVVAVAAANGASGGTPDTQ